MCELENVPRGAESRYGFEVVLPDDQLIKPGQQAEVVLRFWAAAPDGMSLPAKARLCDGGRAVATAIIQHLHPGT